MIDIKNYPYLKKSLDEADRFMMDIIDHIMKNVDKPNINELLLKISDCLNEVILYFVSTYPQYKNKLDQIMILK